MKYLRLENGFVQKGDPISFRWDKLNLPENELKIIERANKFDKKELQKALLWCDEIWFQTTFINHDELYSIALMLDKLPPKTIRCYNLSGKTIHYNISSLLTKEEVAPLDKHKIWEIHYSSEDDILIDLSSFKKEIEEEARLRKEYNDSLINTKEHVLIGKVTTVGKQWSNLKEGGIVPVIETPKTDTQPKRGVWVRGLEGEPVKLLNEDRRLEFKFVELKAKNLAREFVSFNSTNITDELFELLVKRINSIQKEINSENITLWEFCDEICNYINVERRFYRSYFENRLKDYISKYTYFSEFSR